jgi:beta-1,4-mannosyl-glycoprotein beta-1,4-N-acetylglucosaminyltransferase
VIIDCFTFFNELDLLEVRLHTLAPWVDAFVLCEANRTFQGAPKPYFFLEDERDLRFCTGRPILAVRVDLSTMDTLPAEAAWLREEVQRRSLYEALEGGYLGTRNTAHGGKLSLMDRIILSDVDEIPDLSVFSQIDPDCPTIMAWNQKLYYYYVNMRCWDWVGPVSCPLGTFRSLFDSDMQLFRNARGKAEMMINGGWHFSFLGGPAAIKQKIQAFSHTEYRHCAADGNIEYALEHGWKKNRDLFGRDMMHFELMPDDSHLPAYLVGNKERFKDWWYE